MPKDNRSDDESATKWPHVSLRLRALRLFGLKLLRGVRTAQDRLVELLGSSVEDRAKLLAATLARSTDDAASYWLQLVVSIGIATLGLVVGSAAVIIGAMLVAPLMRPIVALAMGLASGSPFLVLRSAGRIVLSVLVATGGAALITILLPFHELNAEIAARTSPTVLDLLTAGFCALAGVYASLRPGSDTAATAAGTSIGISLVPPLCASGYGFGTSLWSAAGGAALLFLTNLVAILFVGTIAFVAVGFNRVDASGLEREALARHRRRLITVAIARRLEGLFASKAGPLLRFLMPLMLLAAVYVPLRRALDEVAWEVRVRGAIEASLQHETNKIVESRVTVEHHEIDVLVVLLGNTADAAVTHKRLEAAIKASSGVAPRIDVHAIPDAAALAGLESTLLTARAPLAAPSYPPPPSEREQLDTGRALIQSSVARIWPAGVAGAPLEIEVSASADPKLHVRVVHLGPPLGADARESIEKGLGEVVSREVRVIDAPIPTETLTPAAGDASFVSRVAAGVLASASSADCNVCVIEPSPPKTVTRANAREQELADALHKLLALHPRVTIEAGDGWQVRFVRGACSAAPPHG